jgi:cob(I)alamin adenosyltransferase
MFDIVDLKTSIYRTRFEAELNPSSADGMAAPFDVIRHDLERIREELFSLPFEQAGRELVVKFQRNFQRLRDFMERVDREISQLAIFSGPGKSGKGGE